MPSLMPSSERVLRAMQLEVRRCGRVGHKALGVAEIVRNADQTQSVEAAERALLAAFDLERDDLAAARHLPCRECRLRVIGAARSRGRASRPGGRRGSRRFCAAVAHCALTRTGSVSRPLSMTHALKGLIDGPVWRSHSCTYLVDEIAFAQHGAAKATALAVDVLRRRIDDDVGAERERPLQHRRRKDVVDDGQNAVIAGDLAAPRRYRRAQASGWTASRRRTSWCSGDRRRARRRDPCRRPASIQCRSADRASRRCSGRSRTAHAPATM